MMKSQIDVHDDTGAVVGSLIVPAKEKERYEDMEGRALGEIADLLDKTNAILSKMEAV